MPPPHDRRAALRSLLATLALVSPGRLRQFGFEFRRVHALLAPALPGRRHRPGEDLRRARPRSRRRSPGSPSTARTPSSPGTDPASRGATDGLTVLDDVTGLTWQKSPDTNGDGTIDSLDKMTLAEAQARPAVLNAARYGGYTDWRLPTIKELYSLIELRGHRRRPGQ